MVQCAELWDISGAPSHWRRGVQTWLCFPFRNHHFSRIDRASLSMADKVRCLYNRMEGCAWTAAPSHVWAAKANDGMLRQTLCSTMRCSVWGGPVGGCCPQGEVAVAGNIMMKPQEQFGCQVFIASQTWQEMNENLQPMQFGKQCPVPFVEWSYQSLYRSLSTQMYAGSQITSQVSVDGLQYKTVKLCKAKILEQQ